MLSVVTLSAMTDELLTVEQAAERLQMHVDTVRRLLREGRLPGRKVGVRTWRISAAALQKYMEGAPKTADADKGSPSGPGNVDEAKS